MPASPPNTTFNTIVKHLGWVERVFLVLLAVYVLLTYVVPGSTWITLIQLAVFILGVWIAIRLLRLAARKAIWRLRNRLLVTYLFIGGVPTLLILALVGLGIWSITSQVAVYLVNSELDRRIDALKLAADSIARTPVSNRADTMQHIDDLFYRDRFPGLAIILRTRSGTLVYPSGSDITPPPVEWKSKSGIVYKDGQYYAWAHVPLSDGDVTVLAPMGVNQLATLVPNLGMAELLKPASGHGTKFAINSTQTLEVQQPTTRLPPPAFRFDAPVSFPSVIPISIYDDPNKEQSTLLYVSSRLSAVYNVLFSRKSDYLQGLIPVLLIAVAIAFLIVELISLFIGVTMTRTITAAVHHLYSGTERVTTGDFGQRIEVTGRDQLSELGHSFNRMTERIRNLLEVSKEKERLQAEIEIASEVQNQLYPKVVPSTRTLKLTAICKPARMVSGDYFDYECIRDTTVALAIGDVAGKGISAALLMATIQASLRTELRNTMEIAKAVGNGDHIQPISTSSLVSHLNEQLYANTAPEKYATFFLGIYDELSGALRYTNAGHLPPILIRQGEATRLNVDGTVVGAFPFARYEESTIDLKTDDLLVCFTDGVSEPENEYGEMFGEDRLAQLVIRNLHKSDEQIVETIIAAVTEWTGSPELQDDMTLLLARRK
jgi:phosphoserine phosphatase RsbU/P